MAKLIICPGCDNFVIDDELPKTNNRCPHCGFSYDNEAKVEEALKVYICPVCGDAYTQYKSYKNNYTCQYCHNKTVKTNINMTKYCELCVYDETNAEENTEKLCLEYGNNQFSNMAYYDRKRQEKEENKREKSHSSNASTQSKNIPKCPTCGSLNVKPISGVERTASVGFFGLFSKKINKSYKCGNCGYTW